MALLEAAVRTLLVAVEPVIETYAVYAPQDIQAPYRIYQRIGAERDFSLQGPTGLADVRMQIDTYAAGYEQARTSAEAVRQALDGYRGTVAGVEILACRLDNDIDLFEAETDPKLFRVSQDFLISHRET